MVNDHGEMKVLKARNEGEDPKSFNKEDKIVLRRLDTKKETSTQGNSHIVSKPSPERVMKSSLKCLKLEAPEIAQKKALLSLPSNAQLVSNL